MSAAAITGVVAVVGIILRKFSKEAAKHHFGDILMGFAILMFDTHEYVDSLKLIKDEAFGENYERFRAKYKLD